MGGIFFSEIGSNLAQERISAQNLASWEILLHKTAKKYIFWNVTNSETKNQARNYSDAERVTKTSFNFSQTTRKATTSEGKPKGQFIPARDFVDKIAPHVLK